MTLPLSTAALVLLEPGEMAEADRQTLAKRPGLPLMERAGAFVADAVSTHFPSARRIAVLAGPGANGGDGFVAARLMAEAGLEVSLFHLSSGARVDAMTATAIADFKGAVAPLSRFSPEGYDLVLDALFGAGLSRPVSADVATVIALTRDSGVPVVAIDLPSGVSGLSGAVLGAAFEAALTVTFFRRKPGHLLHPGRALCGTVVVGDIGIETDVLEGIQPKTFANGPGLWSDLLRGPTADGHKYDRGHAVVFSGGASKTGAARMAAMAALRTGAGLVTVFSPGSALQVNAAHLTAIMLRRCNNTAELQAHLEDERLSVFVLGPGFGAGDLAREHALAVLAARRSLVLDADGLTAFAEQPDALFDAVLGTGAPIVLTPHGGEFRKLFADIAADDSLSKPGKARAAAARFGAVVILKGADTVIAAPDGRVAINENGTPWLATAGSGDVLAGIVAGLLSQKLPVFEAAAAAVWMHGKAAEIFGPGLIAEDLPGLLPQVYRELDVGRR